MTGPIMAAIKQEVLSASLRELASYLDGASRDGYRSKLHRTLRIAQKEREWLELLQVALTRLGTRGWIYREGRRDVWVLETSWEGPGSARDPRGFVRGYFDAEGGVPRHYDSRFYVQMCQKDHADLSAVRSLMYGLGIEVGEMHNPSHRVDPDYWRFYVRSRSHAVFARAIGSWHPRKRLVLQRRFGDAATSVSGL